MAGRSATPSPLTSSFTAPASLSPLPPMEAPAFVKFPLTTRIRSPLHDCASPSSYPFLPSIRNLSFSCTSSLISSGHSFSHDSFSDRSVNGLPVSGCSSRSFSSDTFSYGFINRLAVSRSRRVYAVSDKSPETFDNVVLSKVKRPLDMDPLSLWNRYLDWLYQHKDLGLYVDVSRIGFTDEFVAQMEPRFQKAFKAMEDLEAGAIANPDEGRMVGHYWLRAPHLSPNQYLQKQIVDSLDRVRRFAADVVNGKIKPPPCPAERFTQVLSIGIGGSALGPEFVAEALAPDNPPLKIRFIDNTDPAGIDRQIAQLGPELSSTLVLVISKSGGTPETRNGLLEVQKAFREKGLDFAKQGVAVTQENSLLDNTARMEGWLARFPMFDWVGGRTSEMSAVGLLPAALQGINIREFLQGAAEMDKATRIPVMKENPAALLALCWYWASDGVGSKDMVVLPYKDSLLLFSRYLQQLVMESLGKEYDLDGNLVTQGLSVYGNKGSTDQHAYIQQLREGVPNFFATFIEVLRDRPPGHDWELEPKVTCGDYLFGMLQGTRSALYANKRESITVTVEEITPKSIGALIALYERAVGLYASLININAYHQPGVEAGKKSAAEVLALQKRVLAVLNEASCKEPAEALTLEQIAQFCQAPSQIEMIYKIIAHMAANDRALIAEGDCGSPKSIKVFIGECNVEELYD